MKSRQLEILLYLLDIKKTTCAVLAQRFEVSQRTILRDLDKLSAMGVPVWTQPGYEGGVFLSPNYRFDRVSSQPRRSGTLFWPFIWLTTCGNGSNPH
ncbi:MAG: helix-turn-helix transcriptional regulator [Eubacteriales bacterium]